MTAREVAVRLGGSTRPIFSCFENMEQLKAQVDAYAKELYREYTQKGLAEPIPNLGVGMQYMRFAQEEPELFKLLYLTKAEGVSGGAMEALQIAQSLVREKVMEIYHMDAETADQYFRDLWLLSFSLATLIVMKECPYTDEEIRTIFAQMSVSLCKAFKEIPGLAEGNYDKDAIFEELIKK